MAFTLANGIGLVSAFGLLSLIFPACHCQTEKGCLQKSGKRDVRFPCWENIIINTSNHRSEVQKKQQFRDEAVKHSKLGEALTCVEENISGICISVLPG